MDFKKLNGLETAICTFGERPSLVPIVAVRGRDGGVIHKCLESLYPNIDLRGIFYLYFNDSPPSFNGSVVKCLVL